MKAQPTSRDLRTADAVLLLEAPTRDATDPFDTSRARFSYILVLAFPAALIALAFAFLSRLTPALLALPRW